MPPRLLFFLMAHTPVVSPLNQTTIGVHNLVTTCISVEEGKHSKLCTLMISSVILTHFQLSTVISNVFPISTVIIPVQVPIPEVICFSCFHAHSTRQFTQDVLHHR